MNILKRIKSALPAIGEVKDASVDNVKAVAGATAAAAGRVIDTGADALDVLMRKSTDDQVREHILLQGRYNDILAIKLDEALRRIDALERKLDGR